MDNLGGENGRRLVGPSAEELGGGGRLMLRGPIGRMTEVLPSIGQLCSGGESRSDCYQTLDQSQMAENKITN